MARTRALVAGSKRRAVRVLRDAGSRLRDAAGRQRSRTTSEMPYDAGDTILDLVRRTDLGVSARILGETHRYDVRRKDVPSLLASAAAVARREGRRALVHADGAVVDLQRGVPARILNAIGRTGRLRILVAGDGNRLVQNVCVDVWTPGAEESWRAIAADAPVRRLRIEPVSEPKRVRLPLDSAPQFPIDAVYTWVNAADPAWRASISRYQELAAIDPDRFTQSDEIRYSLRSLDLFAPWVRRVHILSNCAPPAWFTPSDRFRWIDHAAAIPAEYLPLFNSDAIETFLHRIPDLAEQFVYFNDDFLLADLVFPRTFFTWDGRSSAFLSARNSTLFLQQLVDAGEAEDWQSSRINGARLLLDRFGVFPTLIHQHAPYALARAQWQALEAEFPEQIEATRRSRFRNPADVSWTAFFYHHYGMVKGTVLPTSGSQYEISTQTMKRLADHGPGARTFAVIADRGGSAADPAFTAFKTRFLKTQWPFASGAERDDA